MINSQAVSTPQKKRLWRQHKQDKFKQIVGDSCMMFNYFYNNNDIFRFINEEDFRNYTLNTYKTMEIESKVFIGAFATVLLVDRVILNRFLPSIRFKQWRLTANILKLVFWPVALFRATNYYFLESQRQVMYNIQQKYKFGFDDYLRGNRIFQRALQSNRLEELLQKREQFDWTGVPDLPDEE